MFCFVIFLATFFFFFFFVLLFFFPSFLENSIVIRKSNQPFKKTAQLSFNKVTRDNKRLLSTTYFLAHGSTSIGVLRRTGEDLSNVSPSSINAVRNWPSFLITAFPCPGTIERIVIFFKFKSSSLQNRKKTKVGELATNETASRKCWLCVQLRTKRKTIRKKAARKIRKKERKKEIKRKAQKERSRKR